MNLPVIELDGLKGYLRLTDFTLSPTITRDLTKMMRCLITGAKNVKILGFQVGPDIRYIIDGIYDIPVETDVLLPTIQYGPYQLTI